VVEAFHAQVPLIVLTADRPPELRDCGAGQTIDQLKLFGGFVRWFVEVGTPEARPAAERWMRTLAARATATAAGPPAGPVHLNFPFREPLVPDAEPPFARTRRGAWTTVDPGMLVPSPDVTATVAANLAGARRPLVVCGPLDDPDPTLPTAVAALATALGAPVLAEPASNLRRPVLLPLLVDAHDAVLRVAEFTDAHPPDAVVRLGAPPTSKALATWLERHDDAMQIVVDGGGQWPEPAGIATTLLRGRPSAVCATLATALPARPASDWAPRWRRAGAAARAALTEALARETAPFEAHAVHDLARVLPAETTLYVGNSMAVRVFDAFWPADAPPVRVLANRGANGIDGFVSSVLGAAAASTGPVVGLCGDLSFYHDLNGLLAVRRHGLRAVLLVLDNDGGGIFDLLPVARCTDVFEEFFVTPHGLDLRPAVEMYGAGFVRVTAPAALAPAVADALAAPRTTVVSLGFDRATSLAAHGRAWAAARAALGGRP
jgi:2-succinyl-5-enolpyruvyl-6-hydroxy-3-cyclohexene-1-carboxylate synthase